MLQIRKKAEDVFKHYNEQGTFILSRGYFKIDNGVFFIVEAGGARRNLYPISEITVYDDTVGGTAETFTTDVELYERLVELRYNLVESGDGGTLTLEQVRTNDNTVLGRIKGDSYFTGKEITDFAQIEDVLGKSQTLTETATITASFPTTYFEIDVSEISTFTLPLIANSEQKTLIFQNKSNFVVNITTDGSDFIWNLGEVVTVVLKENETAILRCSEGFWNVTSLNKLVTLEQARANGDTVTGRIKGDALFTSKTTNDFAQIGDVDTAVSSKAPINNPTFTGSVVVPNATNNNEAVALGQVLKNQITKSGNQTLDNSYNGKVVTFTGSGTFTVNNTIAEEGSFALKVETGVTVAWAITSPATWRVGGLTVGTAPRSLVGGDMVYVARKGNTNEIEVYGL